MVHFEVRRAAGAAVVALLLGAGAAGCGGARQDADEPSGQFRVRVTSASFPERQAISQEATLRLEVRNADRRTLPDASVTVETRPEQTSAGAAPVAFGVANTADARLADDRRPVWILDRQPENGETAYTNTWSVGEMFPGETREVVWKLLPVRAGRYRVTWRVSPGLDGKARAARGERVRGSFDVTISNQPVPATVDDKGEVVRGARADASGQ